MGTHKKKAKCIIGMFEKRAVLFPISIDWVFNTDYASIVNITHFRQINQQMYIVYFFTHKNIFEILFSYIIYC